MELKNTNLSFFVESEGRFSCPIGDYFRYFPVEKYDLTNISTSSRQMSGLIKELNLYFKIFKPPFKFETNGDVYFPHEIYFDETRLFQFKNGFIPVCLMFVVPNYPPSIGYFSWDG